MKVELGPLHVNGRPHIPLEEVIAIVAGAPVLQDDPRRREGDARRRGCAAEVSEHPAGIEPWIVEEPPEIGTECPLKGGALLAIQLLDPLDRLGLLRTAGLARRCLLCVSADGERKPDCRQGRDRGQQLTD